MHTFTYTYIHAYKHTYLFNKATQRQSHIFIGWPLQKNKTSVLPENVWPNSIWLRK